MAHAWRSIHYARAYAELHPGSQPVVEPIAGFFAVYVAPDSPLNRASGLGLSGSVLAADLELLEAFYRVRGTPTRVDVCPLAHPSLIEVLRQRGYHLERCFNVLAMKLPVTTIEVDGIDVRRAGPEEAELWLRTVAQGFDDSHLPSKSTLEINGPNFYSANALTYLAYIGEEPVGGGGIYVHEGVAEFGGASTRPAYRRRGVQTALVNARLAVAQQMGCDLALTFTTPGSVSQRNIERAGFRLAYTQLILVK
jgi:GNAT superfamily N-acetyltransferase